MRNLKNKMLRRRKKQEEIRRLERERLARIQQLQKIMMKI